MKTVAVQDNLLCAALCEWELMVPECHLCAQKSQLFSPCLPSGLSEQCSVYLFSMQNKFPV